MWARRGCIGFAGAISGVLAGEGVCATVCLRICICMYVSKELPVLFYVTLCVLLCRSVYNMDACAAAVVVGRHASAPIAIPQSVRIQPALARVPCRCDVLVSVR